MEAQVPSNNFTLQLHPSQIMVEGQGSLADVLARLQSQVAGLSDGVSTGQALNATLCQSVQQLVDENERLRRQNTTQSQSIQQLINKNEHLRQQIICEYEEARFRKFKQLPKEIRCMIWRFALTEPQLHPIFEGCEDDFDRIYTGPPQRFYSKINITMQACREARTEALNLKLPYLRTTIYGSQANIQFKNYLNFNIDTLWVDDYESEDNPANPAYPPDIYCPHCDLVMTVWPKGSLYNDSPERDACHCSSRPSLHAIAIDFRRWFLDRFESLEDWIAIFNPHKLYLVVARPYWRSKHRLRFEKIMDGESKDSWHTRDSIDRPGFFDENAEVEEVKSNMKKKRLAFIQQLTDDLEFEVEAEDENKVLIHDRLKVLNEMKFPCIEFVRGIPLDA